MIKDNFNRRLEEKLNSFDPQLPDNDWEIFEGKLSSHLSNSNKKRTLFFINSWQKVLAIAASLALLISIGTTLFLSSNSNKNIEIEQNNTTSNLIAKTNSNDAEFTPKIEAKKLLSLTANTTEQKVEKTERIKTVERVQVIETASVIQKSAPIAQKVQIIDTEPVVEEVQIIKKAHVVEARATKTALQLTPEEAEEIMQQINKEAEITLQKSDKKQNKKKTTRRKLDLNLLASLAPIEDSKTQSLEQQPLMAQSKPMYMSQREIARRTANHKLPITLGMQIGMELVKNLDLRTGITYTGLYSNFRTTLNEKENYNIDRQQLHYIGVPIELSYRFWNISWVNTYAALGAKADWCISSSNTTSLYNTEGSLLSKEDTNVAITNKNNPLWSFRVKLGAAFKVYKFINFYVEPSFSVYLIDSKNPQPESYITQSPYNFTLEAGFRFNL